MDPVTVVGLSDYSSFSGNPILKSDPDGDCAECPKKGAPAGTQHTERGPAGMTPVGGMVFAGKNASLTYINVGDEVNSQWVIGRFATNSGKSYTWNNDKKWYVDNEGKEYSQMIFHNMMDWAQRTMGKPMAEASKNFFDGIPFKDTRVAYAGYQLQGGYGVGGFIASGLANSVSEWGGDLAAGGHRTGQALIGLWRFSSEMAKGSGISFNAAKGVGQGFNSFSAFKRAMGPAGQGQAWHHIVEQTPGNIAKFGNQTIHNTSNLMKLPHGAGSIHNRLSGHYSSIQDFTNGQTVRKWLSTQSYQAQYDYGIKMLKQFGWTP